LVLLEPFPVPTSKRGLPRVARSARLFSHLENRGRKKVSPKYQWTTRLHGVGLRERQIQRYMIITSIQWVGKVKSFLQCWSRYINPCFSRQLSAATLAERYTNLWVQTQQRKKCYNAATPLTSVYGGHYKHTSAGART
jgi:hypothetical protein